MSTGARKLKEIARRRHKKREATNLAERCGFESNCPDCRNWAKSESGEHCRAYSAGERRPVGCPHFERNMVDRRVRCINNEGIAERFTVGAVYDAAFYYDDDEEYLRVTDNQGVPVDCDWEQFEAAGEPK